MTDIPSWRAIPSWRQTQHDRIGAMADGDIPRGDSDVWFVTWGSRTVEITNWSPQPETWQDRLRRRISGWGYSIRNRWDDFRWSISNGLHWLADRAAPSERDWL